MDTTVQQEEKLRQAHRYLRLHPQARVQFARDACLPMRSKYSTCNACEEVCPPGVLKLRPGDLEISDRCVNCGRCAAACPTGALAVDGFGDLVTPHFARGDVEVECWKVPGDKVGRNAVRVPCTGGVSTGQWLALIAQARGKPVCVVDRGWCAICPAGGQPHPARAAIDRANAYLDEMGVPADCRIASERRPLAQASMPESIPDTLEVSAISRRAFFGSLASGIAVAAGKASAAHPMQERPAPLRETATASRSVERDRTLLALQAVAARESRPLPVSAFPALRVSDACRNHNVCAATCATGAIVRYEDESAAGIAFDSSACIACGDCERTCPERAISLQPEGITGVPREPMRLTRFRPGECDACGDRFPAGGMETLCPDCAKSDHLSRSAFRQLFGGSP